MFDGRLVRALAILFKRSSSADCVEKGIFCENSSVYKNYYLLKTIG
jgi:hypothetical protein